MRRASIAAVMMSWACVGAGCFPELPDRLASPGPLADVEPGTDGLPADVSVDAGPDRGPAIDARPPDARPPMAERCNGLDDDADGATDEAFPLDMPCTAGQGACATDGVTICAADGMGVVCDATAGSPSMELCNGIDDDCSGVVDEGFEGIDDPCEAGQGICRTGGALRCSDDGTRVECSARSADALRRLEQCNDIDDDCDGTIDNGLERGCRVAEVGICEPGRQVCSEGEWSACVGDVQPDGRRDTCNGLDDDCDLAVDEDDLPEGNVPCGPICDLAIDGCVPSTPCIEQCRADGGLGFTCAPAPEVDCDGRDDDCDGIVDDDGACGLPIVETCTFGLGWSVQEIESPAGEWGDCNLAGGGFDDTYSCNGTAGDGFSTVILPGDADIDAVDDVLGVTLRCSPGEVGDYIVSQCRVVLGVASPDGAVGDGSEAWGACPEQRAGGSPNQACTSNTADGEFLPIPIPFDLDLDALMGIAFVCADPADPGRAAALQASVAVSLGWADGSLDDGDVDWQAACGPLGDGEPYTGCATTRGDGRFRVFRLTADVDVGDRFAIRLRALGR